MKKKLIFIICFLLFFAFLLYVFFIVYNNNLGNNYYNKKDYKKAISYHQKSNNLLKNKYSQYNLWLDNYKLWNYEKAKNFFENIQWGNNKNFNQKLFFNLGNTFFYLWKKEQDINNKIKKWEKSLEYFAKSLAIQDDKKSQENYNYVKKKLDELKKEKEESEKEIQEKNWEENKQKEKTSSWSQEKGKEEKWKISDTNNSWKSWNTKDSLTQEEEEYLEWYKEYLERNQKENQIYFNNSSETQSDDIFESFFNNPFFDNSSLWGNEKDW